MALCPPCHSGARVKRANYDVQLHIENLDQQSLDSGVAATRCPGMTKTYDRPLVGILLKGTSLSTRISPGRPSTRSAMMLRRISSVPPAIRIEGEDSSICWN